MNWCAAMQKPECPPLSFQAHVVKRKCGPLFLKKMLRCLQIVLLMNGWDQLLWLSELLSDQTKGAGVGW